jgi:3-dehydroquinate dehydratase II
MRLLLVHGPNLNRLGSRDPKVYGTTTLQQIVDAVAERARQRGITVSAFQSNHEGALIDWLQAEAPEADAIVINPGGLAHYSVALRDALEDTKRPVVEVHISQPSAREAFRHPLVTATAAIKVISGKGKDGYLEAVDLIAARLRQG